MKRSTFWGYLFISPWLIGLFLFTLGPILAAFYFSFTEYSVFESPIFTGFSNYIRIFSEDELFPKVVFNTIYYVGLRVPLHVGLGLLLATLLCKNFRGISIFRTAMYLPTIVPAVAAAAIWMWVLDPQIGILNQMLARIGIIAPNWLGSELFSKPTLIFISLWRVGSIMMIFLAGLKDIPDYLFEAADIDGASRWRKFWMIKIPMITPTILYNFVMDIINSFQVFSDAFIITDGGPLHSTNFIVLYIYKNAFQYFQMGYACALAVILFLVIFVITVILMKSSDSWVHYDRV